MQTPEWGLDMGFQQTLIDPEGGALGDLSPSFGGRLSAEQAPACPCVLWG